VVSRAATGSSARFFNWLPWWKAEEDSGSGSPNKRGSLHRLQPGLGVVSLLSAGRGGEGEWGGSLGFPGSCRWSWETEAQGSSCASEAGFCSGVHQQRPMFADAIFVQGRTSAPGCVSSLGFLFLD
jgi:hypothetical protein